MYKSRMLSLNKEFRPLPTNIGDEIFPNGIFRFNISKIIEHIATGELSVEKERIHVTKRFT